MLVDGGAQVIDVRPVPGYAARHIPGSLAIPLRGAFATWLGWLVPDPATPLVIVAGLGQDLPEAAWQAIKIGHDNPARTPAGGKPAWAAAGAAPAPPPRTPPAAAAAGRRIRLGLRANLAQFSLLVAVNALVGGTLGQERTVVPLLASRVFHMDAFTSALTFILAFGAVKAITNFFAGTLSDRYGRKPVLVAGWLV